MIEKVTMRFHRKLLNVEESGITFNSSEDMSGNMENSTLGPDLFNLHELKNGAILLYIIGKQKTNIYILIYSIRYSINFLKTRLNQVIIVLRSMAIRVVKFSSRGYKIRKIFA